MTQRARPYLSVEEYLELEEISQLRGEYYAGEIYWMAGGTRRHNKISGNALGLLKQAFRSRGCEGYGSDMKIEIETPTFFSYPDVVITCDVGDPEADNETTITKPLLIVEVLSPSTAVYDATTKFSLYKKLPSFEHYFLVEQSKVEIKYHYKTKTGGWKSRIYTNLDDRIKLNGFEDISLVVADFYDQVNFRAAND